MATDVKMAYQIPIALLEEYRGDFDFALAHLCNFSFKYGAYYSKATSEGRFVLLDNSIHELGYPLTIEEIAEADAQIGRASYIIPPDWHFDPIKTVEAFHIAKERFGASRLAPVIQGESVEDLQFCYDLFVGHGCNIVCLPYRSLNRFKIQTYNYIRHHFLSFHTVSEIEQMREFPNPTCDTGKPFRFAQNNMTLPIWERHDNNLAKLDMNSSAINHDLLKENLEWINHACKGHLPKG